MTLEQLAQHMEAYAETYRLDAEACSMERNVRFFEGKAEAFATAASWVRIAQRAEERANKI